MLVISGGVSPACAHARATMRAERIRSFFCIVGAPCRRASIGIMRAFDPSRS